MGERWLPLHIVAHQLLPVYIQDRFWVVENRLYDRFYVLVVELVLPYGNVC